MAKINKQDVRQFLMETWDLDASEFSDDGSLFSSGLLDSLSIVQLIAFIESELETSLPVAQLSLDEFDTVDAIVELASRFQTDQIGSDA